MLQAFSASAEWAATRSGYFTTEKYFLIYSPERIERFGDPAYSEWQEDERLLLPENRFFSPAHSQAFH
jgi:hypothetical protein